LVLRWVALPSGSLAYAGVQKGGSGVEGSPVALNVRSNEPDATVLICVTPDEKEMLDTLRAIVYGSLCVVRRNNMIDHMKMEITLKPGKSKA